MRSIRKRVRQLLSTARKHHFNTRANELLFRGKEFGTPFDPSPDFIYGFKGQNESVDSIIESDRKLLNKLGLTYGQLADLIEEIFATGEDEFCSCPIIRWEHVHSPVCPWGDFCTKSMYDFGPQIMEIWLCNPEHMPEIQKWYGSLNTVGYPIGDLKDFVDKGWVMAFSDLHPHLIRDHHFLEGLETPYRVDPIKLVKML